MFWIILTIVCMLLAAISIRKFNDLFDDVWEFMSKIFTILTILFSLISIVIVSSGVSDYPYLTGLRAEAVSLQKRIIDIKKAKYEYKTDGKFVAGSIENMQQSQVLSKYIKFVAYKEAEYNKYLERVKIHRTEPIFYWFSDGFAISDKVLDMKKL